MPSSRIAGSPLRAIVLGCALLFGAAATADAQTCSEARNGWQPIGTVANGPGMGHPTDVGFRIHLADFDGDKRADYLLVEEGGGARVWLNRGGDGRGGWLYRGRVLNGAGTPASRVSFADVSGDGWADYLVQGQNGSVDAWINLGGDVFDDEGWHSGWSPRPGFARGGNRDPGYVYFADFDGDDRADYATLDDFRTGSLTVSINMGGDRPDAAGWLKPQQWARGAIGGDFFYFNLAHLSCDRRIDYVTLNDLGALRVWLNNGGDIPGGGGWLPTDITARGAGTPLVTFADFDGDGLDDYNVIKPNGSVETYLNRGGDRRP